MIKATCPELYERWWAERKPRPDRDQAPAGRDLAGFVRFVARERGSTEGLAGLLNMPSTFVGEMLAGSSAV